MERWKNFIAKSGVKYKIVVTFTQVGNNPPFVDVSTRVIFHTRSSPALVLGELLNDLWSPV